MTTLSSQIEAYEEIKDILETDHFGKWVVFHAGELVDTYDAFEQAAEDAVRRFGRGPYLIRRVGAGPVRLPPSVWYAAMNFKELLAACPVDIDEYLVRPREFPRDVDLGLNYDFAP